MLSAECSAVGRSGIGSRFVFTDAPNKTGTIKTNAPANTAVTQHFDGAVTRARPEGSTTRVGDVAVRVTGSDDSPISRMTQSSRSLSRRQDFRVEGRCARLAEPEEATILKHKLSAAGWATEQFAKLPLLYAHLNNRLAIKLLDAGATHNLVCESLAQKIHGEVITLENGNF